VLRAASSAVCVHRTLRPQRATIHSQWWRVHCRPHTQQWSSADTAARVDVHPGPLVAHPSHDKMINSTQRTHFSNTVSSQPSNKTGPSKMLYLEMRCFVFCIKSLLFVLIGILNFFTLFWYTLYSIMFHLTVGLGPYTSATDNWYISSNYFNHGNIETSNNKF